MHISGFCQAFMEFESFFKQMRGLAVAAGSACSFVVVHELISEGRMSNVVDNNLCSFLRGQAANICNALFGNEHMGIMFTSEQQRKSCRPLWCCGRRSRTGMRCGRSRRNHRYRSSAWCLLHGWSLHDRKYPFPERCSCR